MCSGPHELYGNLGKELAERLAGMMPRGDAALIARKPYFADWVVAGSDVKPWEKIAETPDTRVKVRLNKERGEVSGDNRLW